ncbi:MAG: hypothetical protein CMP20_02740 [Rickettsiales bacterium]|nr:hypothetical protein [Rickettsiales bacterium]
MEEAFGLRLSARSVDVCRNLAKKPDLSGTFVEPSILIHHANFADDLEVVDLPPGSTLRFLQLYKLGLSRATKARKRFEAGEVVCLIGPSGILEEEAELYPNFEGIYSTAIAYEWDQAGKPSKRMFWVPSDLDTDPSINIMDTNLLGLETEATLSSNLDFHTVFADVVLGITPLKIPMGIYVAEKTIEAGDYLVCDYGVGYFNFSPSVVAGMYKEFMTTFDEITGLKNNRTDMQKFYDIRVQTLEQAQKSDFQKLQAEKQVSERLKAENAKLQQKVKDLENNQASRLNAENAKLRKAVKKMIEESQAQELTLADMHAKWQGEKQVSNRLETENRKLRQKVIGLIAETHPLKEAREKDRLGAEIAKLQEKLARLDAEKTQVQADAQQVYERLTAENAKLQQNIAELQANSLNAELREALDEANAKWQAEKQVSERLDAENAKLHKAVKTLNSECRFTTLEQRTDFAFQTANLLEQLKAKDNEIACLNEALQNAQDVVRRNMLDVNEHQRTKNLLAIAQRHLKLFQLGGNSQ